MCVLYNEMLTNLVRLQMSKVRRFFLEMRVVAGRLQLGSHCAIEEKAAWHKITRQNPRRRV